MLPHHQPGLGKAAPPTVEEERVHRQPCPERVVGNKESPSHGWSASGWEEEILRRKKCVKWSSPEQKARLARTQRSVAELLAGW